MTRRIEIELTSARPDGSWTWRAAGAREPKGVLDGTLLHADAKAGDVLKAEADFELEGIAIISVSAPRPDGRRQAQRIEVVGPARADTPGVTTQLVGRSDRRTGDKRRDRDRDEIRGPRRERTPGRPPAGREGARPPREGASGEASREQRGRVDGGPAEGGRSDGPRRDRPRRGDGAADRSGPARDRQSADRQPGSGQPGSGQSADRQPGSRPPGSRRPSGENRTADQADRRKDRRLTPGNTHRKAVLDALPPEQLPIAEQVLRGGIPAVRTALHLEREKAISEGRAAPNTDELIAMAEAVLPKLKAAEWRDRAEAAAADVDGISLRDLRSVVTGADAARDDETRALGATLREALERRVGRLHQDWAEEITRHLDEKKVVRALRLSSRPPEPSARLDAELSARLAAAAGESMSPDASPELWAALLDAGAVSPVRRSISPAGLPDNAPPDLKRAAHQQSGTIPALAKLLGVAIPPPPVPVAARRPSEPQGAAGRPPRRNRGEGERRPPRPPRAAAPQPDTAAQPDTTAHPDTTAPPPDTTTQSATPAQPDTIDVAPGPRANESTEGGENPVVVEELSQPLDQA